MVVVIKKKPKAFGKRRIAIDKKPLAGKPVIRVKKPTPVRRRRPKIVSIVKKSKPKKKQKKKKLTFLQKTKALLKQDFKKLFG